MVLRADGEGYGASLRRKEAGSRVKPGMTVLYVASAVYSTGLPLLYMYRTTNGVIPAKRSQGLFGNWPRPRFLLMWRAKTLWRIAPLSLRAQRRNPVLLRENSGLPRRCAPRKDGPCSQVARTDQTMTAGFCPAVCAIAPRCAPCHLLKCQGWRAFAAASASIHLRPADRAADEAAEAAACCGELAA